MYLSSVKPLIIRTFANINKNDIEKECDSDSEIRPFLILLIVLIIQ